MARYEAAEQYYKRALAILEAAHGLEHPEVAGLMHNLSALYSDIGMYKQAEDLARRSLAIHEAVLGKDDPQVALNLGVLARICNAAGRAGEAEALERRALKIRETRLGKNHPAVATTSMNWPATWPVSDGTATRSFVSPSSLNSCATGLGR